MAEDIAQELDRLLLCIDDISADLCFMEFSSRTGCQECAGDADGSSGDDEYGPEREERLLGSSLELSETACKEDRCEQRKRGIGGRDVVGEASLDRCEE